MTPQVSVLLTTYNGAKHGWLAACIDSVLRQTFQDFEFLIIDDDSMDATLRIVRSYADSRICLIPNTRNLGQAMSLNKGLEAARGRYVARVDQDDVCRPDRLARQVQALQRNDSLVAVGCWEEWINARGEIVGTYRPRVRSRDDFRFKLLMDRCPLSHPCVMFERAAVWQLGGYSRRFPLAEDYALWCHVTSGGLDVDVVPETLMSRRISKDQQSEKKRAVQAASMRRARQELLTVLEYRGESFWACAGGRLLFPLVHRLAG